MKKVIVMRHGAADFALGKTVNLAFDLLPRADVSKLSHAQIRSEIDKTADSLSNQQKGIATEMIKSLQACKPGDFIIAPTAKTVSILTVVKGYFYKDNRHSITAKVIELDLERSKISQNMRAALKAPRIVYLVSDSRLLTELSGESVATTNEPRRLIRTEYTIREGFTVAIETDDGTLFGYEDYEKVIEFLKLERTI